MFLLHCFSTLLYMSCISLHLAPAHHHLLLWPIFVNCNRILRKKLVLLLFLARKQISGTSTALCLNPKSSPTTWFKHRRFSWQQEWSIQVLYVSLIPWIIITITPFDGKYCLRIHIYKSNVQIVCDAPRVITDNLDVTTFVSEVLLARNSAYWVILR